LTEQRKQIAMNKSKKRILVVAAASLMLLPAAARADIVFDPTNFVEAVLQVESDIQMVDNLYQEVTNDVAMVKGWNFTQLPGLLQNMNVWQQVFGPGGQAGTTYSSTDPANALSTMFPSDLATFANTTDTAIASMRSGWDQEERSVLVENRTVQNQTYLNLQPTAQRIQQYVEHSNSASGATSAMQAGNEETATLIAQLQTLQSQEITDGRAEVEKAAQAQAEQAYAQAQQQAVRGNWSSPQQPSTSLVNAFPLANQ
jgi:P-type conjugative transfer protein TrbJ